MQLNDAPVDSSTEETEQACTTPDWRQIHCQLQWLLKVKSTHFLVNVIFSSGIWELKEMWSDAQRYDAYIWSMADSKQQ